MKKNLLLLLMFLGATMINAQSYTSSQETLRRGIMSYLSDKGYLPEQQADGLKFKNGEANYYIEISMDDRYPMFIRFCRYVKYSDEIKPETVVGKLEDCGKLLAIKAVCTESAVVLSTEMFVNSASNFTDVFPTVFSQMKDAYNRLKK